MQHEQSGFMTERTCPFKIKASYAHLRLLDEQGCVSACVHSCMRVHGYQEMKTVFSST